MSLSGISIKFRKIQIKTGTRLITQIGCRIEIDPFPNTTHRTQWQNQKQKKTSNYKWLSHEFQSIMKQFHCYWNQFSARQKWCHMKNQHVCVVWKKNKNKNATNWKIFIYYMNEMTRFVFHSNATPTAFSRIVCRQKCMCQITPNCNTIRSTNFYRIHTMSTGRSHARVKPYYLYKIFLCVHKNISFNIYCNTFFTIHLI